MEFNNNKLIYYENAEKAEIGKKYYFMDYADELVIHGNISADFLSTLDHVNPCGSYSVFVNDKGDAYSFIYPYEE